MKSALLSEWITGLTFCISHQPFASLQKRMPIGDHKGRQSAYNWAALYRKRFAMLRYRRSLQDPRLGARSREILVQGVGAIHTDYAGLVPTAALDVMTKDQLADVALRDAGSKNRLLGFNSFFHKMRKAATKRVLIILQVLLLCSTAHGVSAQTVILTEDFGSGAINPGPELAAGITTLCYENLTGICDRYIGGDPNVVDDGEYTIANDPSVAFPGAFRSMPDHTGNTDGRMMVINAELQPDVMYSRSVTAPLIGNNRTITISAYLANINTVGTADYCGTTPGGYILPNVTFQVLDSSGTVLGAVDSGDIAIENSNVDIWKLNSGTILIPDGQTNFTTRIINNAPGGCGNDLAIDDVSAVVEVVPPPSPAFPSGPGLSASACNVTTPTGNAFADIGMRWDNNGNINGSIDRTDLFSAIGSQSVSGLTAVNNLNDLNIDRNSVPASFSASSYVAYNFTTQAYTNTVELYGIGVAGYAATQPWHNQASGVYKFAIQVDDDPAFASPQTLLADTQMSNGDMPGAAAGVFVADFGTAIYNFGHYDASGTVVTLAPSTTYYVRVYPFDDTASGKDDQQPYADIVLWDDFMLKAVSCTVTQIDAADDDFSANPIEGSIGGTVGNAFANDTFNNNPIDPALIDTAVVTAATPAAPGALVPYLTTLGASEGQVIVPAGTPEGTYTITYQICETANTANCKSANITVVVQRGGAISGLLYEDLDGSGAYNGSEPTLPAGIIVTLYNDNGSPSNFADDTLVGTTGTLADGTYGFDPLSAGTYRIALDSADPAIPAGLVVSTAAPLISVAVAVGATTTGQDFGFILGQADLSVTKQARSAVDASPITAALAGAAVDFVITITNDGPAATTGVVVQDKLLSGFAYVQDDAASSGTTYDPGTGLWVVGSLAPGASQVLTIRVTMLATGVHTNTAEVIASALADPDSDPDVGAATDDLSDGIADDDEATVTIALSPSGQVLSGRVFLDNGAGGATAHDNILSGTEIGTDKAVVTLLDASGVFLAAPALDAAGQWSLALPQGYTGAVTVVVTATGGLITVSETAQALPARVNADPSDGQFTFTPAAATDYADLDVGLIREARLTKSQEAAIGAGQVVTLRHEYIAGSTGTVSFALTNVTTQSADAFAATLFIDTNCDGTPDAALSGPQLVTVGSQLCVIARVAASSSLGDNAAYAFDVLAETIYTGIAVRETDVNTDRLTSTAGNGYLVLTKTVRNETEGTPEDQSNKGWVGDVLEYRIYVTNPSQEMAMNVVIHDHTPAYTQLAEAVPSPLLLGLSLSCTLAAPAVNNAGYVGALRWDCTGPFAPGETGSVSFKVAIAP
jgi:uncharacterized repeat protein (TIGR01451 family)